MNDDALFDDEEVTLRRHASYVGSRPVESAAGALRARHHALQEVLAAVEVTCLRFDSTDPSANAAQLALRVRVGMVSLLAAHLAHLGSYAEDPSLTPLFGNEGLVAPFLAGTTMWASEVADALGALARDLNTLTPDWAAFRTRIADVAWIFDMAATEGRHLVDVVSLVAAELHDPLAAAYDTLVATRARLDEPMG